jgi:hypothetical protein
LKDPARFRQFHVDDSGFPDQQNFIQEDVLHGDEGPVRVQEIQYSLWAGMHFSLVSQEEVDIQRTVRAEMDVRAALEFFDFQWSLSFPWGGFLSGRNDRRRAWNPWQRTIG